ncbi:hypothetical protein MRX96_039083 [Rhipicephalus microplus]
MGRGWIKGLRIELRSVMDVKAITLVEGLVAEYASVFDDALGTFKGVSAKITIEDNAKPRFFKARPVPFTMIDRVNKELMRMERVGVLRPTVGVGGAIKNTCGRTSPQLVHLLDCHLSDRLIHRRQCYRLCNKLRQPRSACRNERVSNRLRN